jgi:hypothetical protein
MEDAQDMSASVLALSHAEEAAEDLRGELLRFHLDIRSTKSDQHRQTPFYIEQRTNLTPLGCLQK